MKWLKFLTGSSLVLSATLLYAGKHPVPLQKDTDSAKCIECHQDKAQGKYVHSAIAMGCTSCHEVRVGKDITRVILIKTSPQAVCFTCHADKDPKEIKGVVHPPAIRDCLKCHDPHTSQYKYQLLKPTTGATKDDNLCLGCHTTGLNVPKGGSRHAALDMGCDTCHITHKTGERGKREFDFHLTKDAPALCLDCHDPKDDSLQKAHQGQPFATADCLTCHDPHQSSAPNLMAKFTHAPFAAGQCDICHAAPKDGKVVLTNANSRDLCLTCHSDKGEQIEKAKVQHPGAAGECIDCHDPHAGNSPAFPKPDPVNVCLGCHTEQAEQGKKAHLHQPAFQQGCATCHEPHGNDNAHLLRMSDTNSLCLECHGPDSEPVKLPTQHLITIFNGQVKLPENYFSKVPILPLKYGLGHPIENHPVSNSVNPNTNAVISMTCLSCHQPHSGAQPGMLVKDQKDNMDFCRTCHANGLNLTDVKVGGN